MSDVREITGMRGLAALMVVFFHGIIFWAAAAGEWTWTPLAKVFSVGWIGVDFFFVVSGFLLCLPLLRTPPNLRSGRFWSAYLGKRWLRIAPPYLVAIVLMLLVMGTWGYLRTGLADVIMHVFYLHSFDLHHFTSINGVFWSLAIEFQFYLILPLFVLLFSRRMWPWSLAACLLLSLGWRAYAFDGSDTTRAFWLSNQVPGFVGHFAVGAVAARLYAERRIRSTWQGLLLWGLAAGCLFVALQWLNHGFAAWPTMSLSLGSNAALRPMVGVAFGALVLAAVSSTGIIARMLASRPAEAVGVMSYSIYLVHLPVGFFVYPHLSTVAGYGIGPFMAVMLVCVLLGSSAFYFAVERPSLALKALWSRRFSRPGNEPNPAQDSPVPPTSPHAPAAAAST